MNKQKEELINKNKKKKKFNFWPLYKTNSPK